LFDTPDVAQSYVVWQLNFCGFDNAPIHNVDQSQIGGQIGFHRLMRLTFVAMPFPTSGQPRLEKFDVGPVTTDLSAEEMPALLRIVCMYKILNECFQLLAATSRADDEAESRFRASASF
jgi:hypothetical protein